MTRAGIYARISLDTEGDSLGVQRQQKACRKLAKERGWQIAGVYVDNDLSASKRTVRRPEYERLCADIEAGTVDAVICWDLDRLTRQPRQLEDFVDLCEKAGMKLLATVGGDVNFGTGDGLLVARIKGAVAADEVAKLAKRIRAKNREKVENGVPHMTGEWKRPFGFQADRITHHAKEADALRRAARAILAGDSIAATTRTIMAKGLMSGEVNNCATRLKTRLLDPRTAGFRQSGGELFPATWEPILDRATWEALRALWGRPGRYSVPHARSMLGGFAFCVCGATLKAQGAYARRIYYCKRRGGGCGKVGIVCDRFESQVLREVEGALGDPRVRKAVERHLSGATTDTDALLAAISADEERLKALAAEVGDMNLTVGEWGALRRPVLDRIEAARVELGRAGRGRRSALSVDELVAALHRGEYREVFDAIALRCVVAPVGRANHGYNPERVTITFG